MDNSRFWWQGAAGPDPDPNDPIGQSLRFRANNEPPGRTATNYLTRPAPASPVTTWTTSYWMKVSGYSDLGEQGSTWGHSDNTSCFSGGGTTTTTSTAFRWNWYVNPNQFNAGNGRTYDDPAAWYHVVHVANGTDIRTYFNGVLTITTTNVLTDSLTQIGKRATYLQFEGYLADYHHVSGQALEPTTFGRYNSNGVWVPVDPKKDNDTAWYGASGFHLTFADPNDVGKDYSGNGNDFTATGFELADTSSPDFDLMQDSPTQNYATLNPLTAPTPLGLKDANLTQLESASSTSSAASTGTIDIADKVYVEFSIRGTNSGQYPGLGVSTPRNRVGVTLAGGEFALYNGGYIYYSSGYLPGPVTSNFTPGDVVAMAYDRTNNKVWFNTNGAIDTSTGGSTLLVPFESDEAAMPMIINNLNSGASINAGQQPFQYTPPAGFEALLTANMPDDELPDTITGAFTGNSNANGPFVYTGCIPGRIQYGTVDVKYQDRLGQTDVDFLSNGFKLRSTTSNSGTVNYTVTTTHDGGEYDGFKVPFQSPAPAVFN